MRGYACALCSLLLTTTAAVAGTPHARPDPASLINSQKVAMQPLANMDGVWRGQAWILTSSGEKHTITQTERVGPFLDGSVKVMEGRGYDADGHVKFNALGIISYQPASKSYAMQAYAEGYAGNFTLKLAEDGFSWEVPAGPVTMRYTATIKDAIWHEIGKRIVPGKPPVHFFDMTLKRVGSTDWPAAGAAPYKP